MNYINHFLRMLQRSVACGTLLALIMHPSPLFCESQPVVATSDSEIELPDNMELIPESDPLYAQTMQAYSAVFGKPDTSVDASPKIEMGPVLRIDGEKKAIVTFKAAAGECAHYALAPTKEAIDDYVEIEFVSNNRLPDNSKWSKSKEKVFFKFLFDKPITSQFNDSGYSSSHGSSLAKDTNHNWGFRLYKNGSLLTKKADYEKYVRHMVSSNSNRSNLASNISIKEGELLIKWGLVDQEFKEQVLDPMLQLAEQIAETEGVHTSAINVEKLARITLGTTVLLPLLVLQSGLLGVIGSIAIIHTLVMLSKKAAAACDARKPTHIASDLRHVVILAR